MNRVCVSYHYFEASPEYKRNFQHFLTFGCHPSLDVVCVIAGPHSVQLPQRPNVQYAFVDNKNFDYGGHAHVVNKYLVDSHYDHLLFVNSSVRGPFLTQHHNSNWAEPFIELLGPGVGLSGLSINIVPETSRYCLAYRQRHGGGGPASHVQSMVYAMPKSTLDILAGAGFYAQSNALGKDELILDYEIHLSQFLVRRGLNLRCLLAEYNQTDYTGIHQDLNPTSKGGDPFFHEAYFGRTPHPYETLFSKTNRDLWPSYYLDMLAYTMLKAGMATAECGLHLDPKAFLAAKHEGELKQLWYAFKKAVWPRIKTR